MNNTGSPRGGSHDLPFVSIGTKTKTIGRLPSEISLTAKMPLMGSPSRRENGSNNKHSSGQSGTGNKPPSPPGLPPAQTSFRQSDVPDPGPPQTKNGGGGGNGGTGGNDGDNGGSKQTSQPAHQTSFPQSEPPEKAPTRSADNGGPPKTDGPPPPQNSSPAAKSSPPFSITPIGSHLEPTSEAGHSRGPKTSNAPGAGGPPAVTITAESFSSAASGVITNQPQSTGTSPTHGSHNTENPQSQSFTDNQHDHGHSITVSKSQTHTLSSTQSFQETFSSTQTVLITSSSITSSTVIQGSKPAPTEPVIGHGPGPKKGGGNGNGNGNGKGKGSQLPQHHSKTTTPSLSSITKSGHPERPTSTTLRHSLIPSPPTIKSTINNSHPTHAAGPNPKASSSILSPQTRIPLPIHFSAAPAVPSTTPVDFPPPQHTPPGQTNKHHTAALPEPPAAPPSHTTAQVTSRPLIPLPIHITQALPPPPSVVNTATNPPELPPQTKPSQILSILQPLLPATEQGGPPVNTIRPTVVLPIDSPSPIDASTPNTETVIPSAGFSPGKGGLVKELLNPDATIPSVPSPSSTGGNIAPHSSEPGKPFLVGTPTSLTSDPSATSNSTWMGHHSNKPNPNENTSSSASNHSASIVGGVLGAVIALLVIALVVVGFCFYRKKLRKLQKRLQVYEKDGDVAPPLYAPHGGYDPRKAYSGQQYIPGNQEPTPPIPIIVHNPYPDATPGEHQTNVASRNFEGQMLTVPPYAKNMNPFVNMASMYPYQPNGDNHGQSPAVETDEKPVQQSNDIGSQYPAEKVNPPWTTFNGDPPRKTRDAHLSKMSTATTLSVGSAYTGKRSSTSTYINDPDENFANVEFDSLKMVKARNAAVVGVAM